MRESIEELRDRWGKLSKRRQGLKEAKSRIEAELSAHKRALKQRMKECQDEGFDPDNLKEDIRKSMEVVKVKLDTFEADIEAGEKIARPMLDKIQKNENA